MKKKKNHSLSILQKWENLFWREHSVCLSHLLIKRSWVWLMKLSAISAETRDIDRTKSAKALWTEVKGDKESGGGWRKAVKHLAFYTVNIFQEKWREEGSQRWFRDRQAYPFPPQAQCTGPGKRQDKVSPLCFQRRGPLPPHKAPVWLGPLQKALALPSPRGWVNQTNWEGDCCTLVGLEAKALNQEGLFLHHHG